MWLIVHGGGFIMRFAFTGYLAVAALLLLCFPLAMVADGTKLAVGDIIAVHVEGEQDLSKNYEINDAGGITMPVVNLVKLVGLNTSDAAAAISKALEKTLVNPQITVAFVDRGKMQIFVVGQVKKPGVVEIGIGDKILQALTLAGYDDTADLSRVSIRRGDEVITLDISKYLSGQDLSANVALKSGDTIVVQNVGFVGSVLVTGQVTKVGSIPVTKGMTFREVMGLVGGVTVDADTEKISVKREGLPDPISVNYKSAMDGDPTTDIALRPGDTVYVPEIETSYYTVMGGVNRPGQYPLKRKLSLSEAIGEAGGPAPNSGDMRNVQLVRRPKANSTAPETSVINLDAILKTKPADQPMVDRGDVIIVAVHKPKTNLWQALQSILPFGWLLRR
jgi:polysaccharide export outer membrane protein